MSKKSFKAESWIQLLKCEAKEEVAEIPSLCRPANLPQFDPKEHLVTGWSGESLISKSGLSVLKLHKDLWNDSKSQFYGFHFNKSLMISVYEEFLLYANTLGINPQGIDHFTSFWEHMKDETSKNREILDQFIDIYCFRVVIAYLLKIRFILSLSREISLSPQTKELLNPNSFLSKIFRKGSRTELNSLSLQTNIYSWYRPSVPYHNQISQFSQNFDILTVAEIMKIFAYSPLAKNEASKLNFDETDYCHALSHKHFGLFLNDLLIFLPEWLRRSKDQNIHHFTNKYPKVLNTKFEGDKLGSLTVSHWLAQNNNVIAKWEEIICPDFVGNDFMNGTFIKICQELQFLTFLIVFAKEQKFDPVEIITKIMSEKYKETTDAQGQTSFFSVDQTKAVSSYERIVLNITDLPKKNSHHYLLGKIHSQIGNLKQGGLLLVMSNQNLFVPSHATKNEELFKILKLETIFNFENLKGKGGIPNYLYVFSKKETFNEALITYASFQSPRINKDSCFTFIFNGDLTVFNKFQNLLMEFENFIFKKNSYSYPLYQKEVAENLNFVFHQDAIVEGKLVHSHQSNSKKITHPSYFKNLTDSSIPFDKFFQFEKIDQKKQTSKKELTTDLLGFRESKEEKYPYLLIVDYSDPAEVNIEITYTSNYSGKVDEYGTAYYHYFGLLPKKPDVNINVFREFFHSEMGKQIIQLSLGGGATRLKAKLRSILIPKFFFEATYLPEDLYSTLDIFRYTKDQILEQDPQILISSLDHCAQVLLKNLNEFPLGSYALLSLFKVNLLNALKEFEETKLKHGLNYNNPLILNPLMEAMSKPLYPHNDDVYVEFLIDDMDMLYAPMQTVALVNSNDNAVLELSVGDRVLVRLHSDEDLLSFIKFILSSAEGTPIVHILQHLEIPKLDRFKPIVSNFHTIKQTLESALIKTQELMAKILSRQISTN